MTKFLLNLALIVTPFFVVPGLDVRDIKLTAASVLATALGLAGLYFVNIKRLNNKWFYILLGYSLVCYIIAPNPSLKMLGMEVGTFWIWQPMYQFLTFGLAIIVISSINFSKRDLAIIFHIMVWCGLIMSLYVLCQAANIDQFFNSVGLDRLGKMAGTIGNPTHVSPFIAMLIPLAIYLRRYIISLIMIVAVCLTTSQVAIGAMIIGLLVYVALCNKVALYSIVTLILLCSVTLGGLLYTKTIQKSDLRTFVSDNQRFMVYEQIIKDVNAKPFKDSDIRYPFTGWGMGNFKYTFHFAHSESETFMRFQQAHCDPLEFLYNTGIIGFLLLLATLFVFFKQKAIKFWNIGLTKPERALLAGFVIICVASCGTFIWQVGTTAMYSCVFFGLLNSKGVKNYA